MAADDQPVIRTGAYCAADLFALAPRNQIPGLAIS